MKLRAAFVLPAILFIAGCGAGNGSNPAATVNGHDISMAAFNAEVHAERLQTVSSIGYDPCTVKDLAPACQVLKRQSLGVLIGRELVQEYAAAHHITLSAIDISRNWSQVFRTRFDNMKAVEKIFLRQAGETEAQLRASLQSDLLQQKVEYTVTASMPTQVPAIRLAQLVAVGSKELTQVRQAIAAGVPFLRIAANLKKVSAKGCVQPGTQCGDLGWVPLSLIPANRHPLTTAPAGSVVGPYLDRVGATTYHQLYYVELRSNHYTLTPQQTVTVRQQLFNAWLQKQESKAKVKRYVAV